MGDRSRARIAGWVLLALAGLAVAVGLSLAASNLSTQPIGLSNEPLRAGDRLAPPAVTRTTTSRKPAKRSVKRRRPAPATTAPAPTATTPAPTVTAPAPATTGAGGDDHGGRRGRGGGSDD
jgi:hypothetical protein